MAEVITPTEPAAAEPVVQIVPQTAPATLIQAILNAEKALPSLEVLRKVFPAFTAKFEKINGPKDISVLRIPLSSKNDVRNSGTDVTETSHCFTTLRDFCKIVNTVLLVDQNDKSLVSINTDTRPVDSPDSKIPSSKYRTFKYHTSADPGVCILPNTNGWPISEYTNSFMQEKIEGDPTEVLNIFVNFDFLDSILRNLVASSKDQRTVYSLFDPLFEALNDAMGGINQLSFHYEESKQTFYIVDRAVQVDNKEEIPILNVTGLKTSVTQFDFTTKLSPAIATMVAVSAQASGQDVGLEAEALFKWNEGLTDRIMTKRKHNLNIAGDTPTDKAAVLKANLEQQQGRIDNITAVLNKYWVNTSYNGEDIKNAVIQYQAYTAYFLQSFKEKDKTSGPAGIIPFEVGIDMDGIAGLKIGQAFRINEGIMPDKYYDRIGFIVTGIEHSISNNRWTTKLKAQTIVLEGSADREDAPDQKAVPRVNPKTGESNNEQEGTDPIPGNYEEVTDNQLFQYLAWQQGAWGSAQHYSLWKQNGKFTRYGKKPDIDFFIGNWPGKLRAKNGVTKGDIANLYATDQARLATGFIDVWRQRYYEAWQYGLKRINSTGANRTGVPYVDIKKAFQTYARPAQGLPFNNLVAIGYIENGLATDTVSSSTFQSMFQMNKTYTAKTGAPYKETLVATNIGQGHKGGWIEYGPADKLAELTVPIIISNFNAFKKYARFTG